MYNGAASLRSQVLMAHNTLHVTMSMVYFSSVLETSIYPCKTFDKVSYFRYTYSAAA